MEVSLFLRGLLLGFSVAAPVGPIGVLVIRRTLAQGRLVGLATGLGAATADALYGCVVGFGLTFVTSLLVGQQLWVRLIGGLLLCYMGVRAFRAAPAERAAAAGGSSLLGAYGATLLLTLTNPATILWFLGIFAGLGLAATSSDYGAASLLVLGVFSGSALWWVLLSGGVGLLRMRLTPDAMRWINRVSGAVLVVFGALALVSIAT